MKTAKTKKRSVAFLAVDPGASGAVAFNSRAGGVVAVPFTTPSDFLNTLRDFVSENADDGVHIRPDDIYAVVEKVGGYVGKAQPASSAFKFGENYGFIQGVLRCLMIPYELVAPAKWEKLYPCSASSKDDKAQHKRELRDHAARLYPQLRPTLKTADALLLLDYAKKTRPAGV